MHYFLYKSKYVRKKVLILTKNLKIQDFTLTWNVKWSTISTDCIQYEEEF